MCDDKHVFGVSRSFSADFFPQCHLVIDKGFGLPRWFPEQSQPVQIMYTRSDIFLREMPPTTLPLLVEADELGTLRAPSWLIAAGTPMAGVVLQG